jgi:transposase
MGLYKKIQIGVLIIQRLKEMEMDTDKLALKLNIPKEKLESDLKNNDMSCSLLLSISKFLEYDFFRIYSMNILLYAPPRMGFEPSAAEKPKGSRVSEVLPVFRKNTYTPEIIQFILNKIEQEGITPQSVINEYHIPKTTLYRWIRKYQ